MIKVVDIFAGPGGLSEGFSSVATRRGNPAFDVVLSIEMDKFALETLQLRTFFRQFPGAVPETYYQYLRGEIRQSDLYSAHPAEANQAAGQCNLGRWPRHQPQHHCRRLPDGDAAPLNANTEFSATV